MTYERPEISLIGEASRVIQAVKFIITGSEGLYTEVVAVYDTEE